MRSRTGFREKMLGVATLPIEAEGAVYAANNFGLPQFSDFRKLMSLPSLERGSESILRTAQNPSARMLLTRDAAPQIATRMFEKTPTFIVNNGEGIKG
jgi:hypothetical protein